MRILVTTLPFGSHIRPMAELVDGLIERGHQITWATGTRFAAAIAARGARFRPLPPRLDWDERDLDASFPGRSLRVGVLRFKFDLRKIFIEPVLEQARVVEALCGEDRYDVLLSDIGFGGAFLYRERTPSARLVALCTAPLYLSGEHVPPYGLGLRPAAGALGRLRDDLLLELGTKVIFRSEHRLVDEHRRRLGLERRGLDQDAPLHAADAVLACSIPELDYPRPDLSPKIRYIGALSRPPRVAPDMTAAWPWLGRGRPIVHVTQGTIDTATSRLVEPTLAALADEPVTVVATIGHGTPAPRRVPANAIVEPFLPHELLLPHVRAMVTNGGFGAVQKALGHGVPLVVAGATEDKPEVAARVEWAGAGINLRTGRPSPRRIRQAVRALLREPRYAACARDLARHYVRYDAVALVDDVLARVVGAPRVEAAPAARSAA
jgi:UDP:flavonoid glycosyltransferase YjiC (YdhE family)